MRKVYHSSATLIVNDLYIDKVFGSMHQRVKTNKTYLGENWTVKIM